MPDKKEVLWIVEDEVGAQYLYKLNLGLKYEIRSFITLMELQTALEAVVALDPNIERPDLLVCDLSLPDGTLLDFVNRYKPLEILKLSLLVVTANDNIESIQAAYKFGVLDYLVKPFNFNELAYKIEHFFAGVRAENAQSQFLTLDSRLHSIYNSYGSVTLTTKEFQVISLLLNAPNRSATKAQIVDVLWQDVKVTGKNLEVQLSRLRTKIKPLQITVVFKDSYYMLTVA